MEYEEKGLRGVLDIEFANYLEKNRVTPTHEDIPTLACAIDARPMEACVPQNINDNYYYKESEITRSILEYTGQRFGESLGETSAK